MKLSKNSKQLMLFFTNNKMIDSVHQTKKTNSIIMEIYNDILTSYKYILHLKQSGDNYNVTTKKILNVKQIPKPQNFNSSSFPELIRKRIDELSMYEICYTFSLFDRNIKIYFIVEEDISKVKIETFNKYVDSIIMWLFILNKYASKQCSHLLIVYFYFTSLEKRFPNSNIYTLDEINVNTAFTTTCPKDSEIVVFRKEEWFKVFIHETFHNFGLDFSDMNNNDPTKYILDIFKVSSNVNLYESYTEFWAEIMNALFCSFVTLNDKNNIEEFLSNSEIYINFERSYSFFQLVKTLNFMGLNYSDLYSNNENSKMLRDQLYKEKTNVLAYYIIKTILINNYQTFLLWCKTNNPSLLQFKKTSSNQLEFCKFIEKKYKTKSMANNISNTQQFLNNMYDNNNNNNKKDQINYYLMTNLRMSICELG